MSPASNPSTEEAPAMAHDLIATFITMAGDCQLAAAGGTEISPHDLFDRVKAVARGGFTGMGFGDRDLRYWLTKYDIGELRQLLDDSGIRHIELEGVVDWFTTGERRQAADRNIDEILSWAAELGALHVKAAFDFVGGADCPHDVLVNEWAKVADRAAVFGQRLALEPMPFATVKTPQQTVKILQDADAVNTGVFIDIWHTVRAGVPLESLREVPGDWIAGIELGDGSAEPVNGNLIEDGLNHRALPGQGEFGVTGFLRAIFSTGFTGPIGAEILSIENRARSLQQAVADNYDAMAKSVQTALA
jgi:sugar phosphate isomerase/epimerase